MRANEKYPYPECDTCKSLTDCKNYILSDSPLSLPLPPNDCPKPIEAMRQHKKYRDMRNNPR